MLIKKSPAGQPESRQRKGVGRTTTTGSQVRPPGTTEQRNPAGAHDWHVQHGQAQAQIQLPVSIQAGMGLDAAFLEAERLYRERQDEEALSLFSSLVALSGQHRDQALFRIGNLHQRRGDTGLALDAYWRLMSLATEGGAAVVPGSRPGPVQREQRARQLKAMINANLLAVEQVRQSLAWIGQLQQDPGIRAAAGLDERMASEISQQLWQHSEQIRQMMENLGAWAPQSHARPAPVPPGPYLTPPPSTASSGPQRVTVVYEQPPRRSRKKSARALSATLTTSMAAAPAVSPSVSEQVTSPKPEILAGGQRAEKPSTAGAITPRDASASAQPQPQPQ
ncbi:MAG: hypothetical protein Q4B17_05665, partial [Lautropia sp.]|nr:hypothetical protein [Lautropia sp.]